MSVIEQLVQILGVMPAIQTLPASKLVLGLKSTFLGDYHSTESTDGLGLGFHLQVGHTGDLKATIQAVATCDKGLGELLATVESLNGRWLVTSDHGNADDMVQVRCRVHAQ